MEIQETEMNEEDLIERRLMLESAKLQKDESDLELKELVEQLDKKIPNKLVLDDIKALKEDLEACIVQDKFGKEIDATDADREIMKQSIKRLERLKELDLPMRKLRFRINSLRVAKNRLDAPEKQIKKLEKEIRVKRISSVARPRPPGVN